MPAAAAFLYCCNGLKGLTTTLMLALQNGYRLTLSLCLLPLIFLLLLLPQCEGL
jgi:hypothetical protein